jgi:hypothetical protein
MTNNEKDIKGMFLKVLTQYSVDNKTQYPDYKDNQYILDKFMYELFSKYVFTECWIEDYCSMYDINIYDKLVEILKNININAVNDLKDAINETCKLTNICKYKI